MSEQKWEKIQHVSQYDNPYVKFFEHKTETMKGRSVLCKQQRNQAQIPVGVARHSIIGCTVYEARLSDHVKKIKWREENETCKEKDDKVTGLCFLVCTYS